MLLKKQADSDQAGVSIYLRTGMMLVTIHKTIKRALDENVEVFRQLASEVNRRLSQIFHCKFICESIYLSITRMTLEFVGHCLTTLNY